MVRMFCLHPFGKLIFSPYKARKPLKARQSANMYMSNSNQTVNKLEGTPKGV
jgi:hypothetical protein